MARWLGKYELLRPIGKGGMAELHLARVAGGMPGTQKLLVVKQMLPTLAGDESFVEMFVDEARLALALDHPNVVHAFDAGSSNGRYYLAMEYLHGEDLAHINAASRGQGTVMPLADALAIAIGVAAGLHYAHEKRDVEGRALEIVHRDVSPQNVLVTYDGAVKLLDFGIAKAAHRLTETRQGTIKGKVRYMAPEQIRSESLDRRADVFALGVLLWEMTTGRPLYSAANEFAMQQEIVNLDARPPSQVVPGYPPALERIVMKAVARRREERFESTELLQLALEEFARERKLAVSSVGLARYLRELFSQKAEALREAQSAGDAAVTEHVLSTLPDDDSESESSSVGSQPRTRPVGLPAEPSLVLPSTQPQALPPSRVRRVALAASLTILAGAGALWVRSYLAEPPHVAAPPIAQAALAPPPVAAPVAPAKVAAPPEVAAPERVRPPAHPVAASRSLTRRKHPPPHRSRWDAEAALPPP